jgi:hypothetical protein
MSNTTRGEVLVRFQNDTKAGQFKVNMARGFIRIPGVKLSDQELYQVTAGNRISKKDFQVQVTVGLRIIVREKPFPNTTGYPTTATSTSNSSSTSLREGKDGIQGWVIGIIILCVLLILTIPTVYVLYKYRQFFCSYFARNRKSKKADITDTTGANYTDAYINLEVPTTSQNRDYANTAFLPDVVNGVPVGNSRELDTANTYDAAAEIFPDTANTYDAVAEIFPGRDTQTEQSQVTAQYAVVDKKKKNCNHSTSNNLEETTLTQQSSDFLHGQQVAVEKTTPGFKEEGNEPHAVRPEAAHRRNPSDIKRPTQHPPPPPVSVQHQPSQEQQFEGGEEPISPCDQRQGKPQTANCFQPSLYAEIDVQTTYPEQQSGQNFRPYPGNQPIQYVDLDLTALSERT